MNIIPMIVHNLPIHHSQLCSNTIHSLTLLPCVGMTHPLLPQLLTSDDAADLSGLAHGRGGAPQPALSVASTSMVSGASTPGSFAAETSTSDSDVEYMIIPDTDYALDLGEMD